MKLKPPVIALIGLVVVNVLLALFCIYLHKISKAPEILFYMHWFFGPSAFFLWGLDALPWFAAFSTGFWVLFSLSLFQREKERRRFFSFAAIAVWIVAPLCSFALSA